MNGGDWLADNRHIAWLLCGVVVAVALLAWWLVPHPGISLDEPAAAQEWRPPPVIEAEASVDQANQALQRLHPWGAEDDLSAEQEEAISWRLTGVIREGERVFALLRLEDSRVERFRVGDELPGQAQLVAIGEDRITVKRRDGTEVEVLYQENPEQQ